MVKLIVLIVAVIILVIIFFILLSLALIQKTKRLLVLTTLTFVIAFSIGLYTLYFGLKKGKEKTGQIAKTAVEKVFPTFDSDIPDTQANKKNFRHFIKVDITPDVTHIYCFDDAIGQDGDYMFSFNCNAKTAEDIIKRHDLTKDSILGNNQEGMQHDFFWWDKKRIDELERFSWNSDNENKKNLHKIFWYDKENQKAYYFEYDL